MAIWQLFHLQNQPVKNGRRYFLVRIIHRAALISTSYPDFTELYHHKEFVNSDMYKFKES